jgi:acetyl/propionyl-CoA carboxylase alpha subunit
VQVGTTYDPMIAKVVTWAPDRPAALHALHGALGALQVAGLPTNADFMRRCALNAEFRRVSQRTAQRSTALPRRSRMGWSRGVRHPAQPHNRTILRR